MPYLFPNLPHISNETPLSYAARLANFHIGQRTVTFLRDFGISPEALAAGKVEAIDRLAEIAGVEAKALRRNAAIDIGKRRFNLRGHILTSEFLASPDTAFCPACLHEDDAGATDVGWARFGRLDWTLLPVRTCPTHGIAMVRRKYGRWDDKFHELAVRVAERDEALDRLIEGCETRSPSPLQAYVAARLEGEAVSPWLDSQSLEQAVRTTEMLGMLIEFGSSARPSQLGHDEWDRAGRTGYAVTSAGEAGIRDALAVVQSGFRGKGSRPGRRAIFGATYEWLSSSRNSTDAGDILRIMRDHIFETMEVGDGETILGVELDRRRLHSVASLAVETGLDTRSLRKVLAASDLIPVEEEISGHHVFDAEAGRRVAASVTRMTHVIALPKALHCTRPQAEQLLDERLLHAISDGRAVAAGRKWKAVDDREVARFLADLNAYALPVDLVPRGLVPIAKAAEKAKASSVEIIHLVLGGFLSNVLRRLDLDGYEAIHVDPVEVRTCMAKSMFGMSASAAFGQLKIPRATGWALVDREDDLRLVPSIIEGQSSRHRIHRFQEEVVTAFASEFTTVARVANKFAVETSVVISRLRQARMKPVLKRDEIGIDLYRTADLPEFELA